VQISGAFMNWMPSAVAGSGMFAAIMQAAAPPDVTPLIGTVERLSLVGALGLAVIFLGRVVTVLYRDIKNKDLQLFEFAKQTQIALVSASDNLRLVVDTNRQLATSIQALQVSITELTAQHQYGMK
jgi:hypothetical protein